MASGREIARLDRVAVGRRLKAARILRGYEDRRELVELLRSQGLPAVALAELERAERGLREIELTAIAKGLAISERWFTLSEAEFDALLLEPPIGSPLIAVLRSLSRIEARLALTPEELEQAIADELRRPQRSARSSEGEQPSTENGSADA